MTTRPPLKLTSLLLSLTLLAAACGDDDSDATAGADTTSGGADATSGAGTSAGAGSAELSELSGSIFITGSSTVEPISIRVAESFEELAPDVIVDVEGPGTGDGFLKFCNGEAAISDASREIKDEEAETCESNGVEYTGLEVAIDGIAVITSPQNDAVDCLSFADLYALLGPESEGFSTWADAQSIASELGSDTQFPDAALDITAPGTESGTYDSFVELALGDPAEERDQDETTRTDYSSAADDNVIVTNISANATSLGWVGYAYFEQNQDSLRALAVSEETGGECVEPTPETIASGEYPLSRSLYIYVNTAMADEDPALAAFVDHYMEVGVTESVDAAGYVQLDDAAMGETRSTWADR